MKKTPKFFSPTSDWGFKRLFGSENNKHLLKYFLNTLIDEKNIVEVTLLNPEHQYVHVEGSRSIFDVYCTCDDGSRIIVECQKTNEGNFTDRAFAYSSMAVIDQEESHWDYNLDMLYFIGVTTFNLFKDSDKCITRAQLTDIDEPGRVVYSKYLQIYVELSKFVATDAELSDAKEVLLYILKHLGGMREVPQWVQDKDKEIGIICRSADFDNLSKEEQEEYIMTQEDIDSWKRCVKQAREEGRASSRTQIAKAMKEQGLAHDVISKCTGLSVEQVAEI